MREAYRLAEGRKVGGRRIIVDIDRGRTEPGWLPRRLGGGKGTGRNPKTKK
jgi:U1 small nuclear ribonucleoprotein 70kDa